MFSYTTRLPRAERYTGAFYSSFLNSHINAYPGALPGTLSNLQTDQFSQTSPGYSVNKAYDYLAAVPAEQAAAEQPDLAGLVQQQFQFKQKLSETINAKCDAHALKDYMLQKNIGELSRLIQTEVENLQSNVDPLNDVLADVVVALQAACSERLSSFTKEQYQFLEALELEISAHEEQIQLLQQQRAQTVQQMRAEFLLSADRLELQIQAEESEQQQQFSSIQRQLEEALCYQAAVINQEYDRKTASLKDAKDDVLASWTLAQKAVEKRYRDVQQSVQNTAAELVSTNQYRIYAESEAVAALKQAISDINKTLLIVGADVEVLRSGIANVDLAKGEALSDVINANNAVNGAKTGKMAAAEAKQAAKTAGKTTTKNY